MGNLWIEETHTAEDAGYLLGEPFAYETFTDDTGELFRAMQKEHGRCISKMYIDTTDGEAQAIGWVFTKRRPYEDVPKKTYLHTVWVSVLREAPKTVTTYNYVESGE